MTIVNKINEIRKKRGGVAVALIDPDAKYENKLPTMIDIINESDFDQDNNMKVSHGKKQHVIVKII